MLGKPKRMSIFMTGATGFIGSHLARHLASAGERVHALVRQPKKAASLESVGVLLFKGDLEDRDQLLRAMEGCTRVFHLAAFARAWHREEQTFDRINYGGGINVMETALEAGIKKMVLTSTGGVVGPAISGPVNESHHGHPDHLTAYERSKARLEAAVPEFINRGLPVVIVNPARVFGPGLLNDSNSEVKLMRSYLDGRFRFVPGNGHAKASYCYVDDVVKGHLAAMERGKPGERYLLGGENASYREFFDTVGLLAGKQRKLYGVPYPLLLGFAKLQVWMGKHFGTSPLITPELVRKYVQDWSFSSEKAKDHLGYDPRSLEESIRLTLEWLKSENAD